MLVVYCPYCLEHRSVHKTDDGRLECDDCDELFDLDLELLKKVKGTVSKIME